MTPKSDYYVVLGVAPDADLDHIRAAYRSLARRFHPDHPGGSDARMAAINAAWAVLRDPNLREAHDRARMARELRRMGAADSGARRAADAPNRATGAVDPPGRPWTPAGGSRQGADVLSFGRYTGWSLDELARHDPNYLDWLAHMPAGRRYKERVETLLHPRPSGPVPGVPSRRGLWASLGARRRA